MPRKFIIVDPEDDVQLLLSQYLSMGWHDADIEEETISSLLDGSATHADTILICGIEIDNPDVKKIVEKSRNGELPPTLLIDENQDADHSDSYNTLSLENLTPVILNGAISEAMKRHADGVSVEVKKPKQAKKKKETSDRDVPLEVMEGLRGYTMIRELGRGGMSRVYLAESHKTGKEVAIKVLDMDTIEDDRMIDRFIREYSMLASIDNIHVASILDQTFTDEFAFIIMERFKGGDLTQRIRKRIPEKKAVNYLKQIAKGLCDVHQQGIVHRDLKPGNIMFRLDETLAILDFGLAQIDDADENNLTRHGEVYGTPSYVSPEQARGKRVDLRSDIYSSGIIFYQMLTRKKPYRADNPMAMFYKHVHAELPKLPAEFSRYQPLLDKMLAKAADDRYQDANELIEVLKEYV